MDDSTDSPAQESPWLLFVHQVPPKPDYLRVKVRRRLQRVGALQLKSTVYVVANSPDALEDLQWIRREILEVGGTALICEASFIAGATNEEIAAMFGASGRKRGSEHSQNARAISPGTTWVTRAGVFIDRIASAWLIRRFIDPQAEFKFVPARGYEPAAGELRFDMYDAEFTHEGEQCTFQTLLRSFGLTHAALGVIGDIVRDIDCRADRFARAETSGVAALIRGIADRHEDDEARLERGAEVFDSLYAAFSQTS
jgi:hypothetical protein